MNPLELWLPVKPYGLNQAFGANPEYYAKFLDAFGNPQKGHTGIDLAASHGQPVYSPCEGDAFYTKDDHGGDGIYIRYPSNAAPQYDIILWHLCSKDDPQYKPLIPCDGSVTTVKRGQLIAYADNTGAPYESSGDHLHIGFIPTDKTGAPLNPANGFGGCIDPAPFLSENFAEDYQAEQAVVSEAAQIIPEIAASPSLTNPQKLSEIQLIANAVISFLTKVGIIH